MTEPGRSWKNAGAELPLTDEHPAINLTWHDAITLTFQMISSPSGPKYYVPTEAEWEYACLAGEAPDAKADALADDAVFDVAGPLPVRSRLPNAWGLFDMLGNLLEWCNFGFHVDRANNPGLSPMCGGKFNDKSYRIRPAARVCEARTSPLGGVRLARPGR